MRTAGVREARQNLSQLIDEVKLGNEVLITERGVPVARLVPAQRSGKPLPDNSEFRRRMPTLVPAVSQTILEEREDRD